jgi:predicted GNAT family acetyltransferase
MNKYNVKIRYSAQLYFEENVTASNEDAAMRKAEKRVNLLLKTMTHDYEVVDDEIYVEKVKDEDVDNGYAW